jgi:hypothetical protein
MPGLMSWTPTWDQFKKKSMRSCSEIQFFLFPEEYESQEREGPLSRLSGLKDTDVLGVPKLRRGGGACIFHPAAHVDLGV